jgi:hypothetical protein
MPLNNNTPLRGRQVEVVVAEKPREVEEMGTDVKQGQTYHGVFSTKGGGEQASSLPKGQDEEYSDSTNPRICVECYTCHHYTGAIEMESEPVPGAGAGRCECRHYCSP